MASPNIHSDGCAAKFCRQLVFEFCNTIGEQRTFAAEARGPHSARLTHSGLAGAFNFHRNNRLDLYSITSCRRGIYTIGGIREIFELFRDNIIERYYCLATGTRFCGNHHVTAR